MNGLTVTNERDQICYNGQISSEKIGPPQTSFWEVLEIKFDLLDP